MAHPAPARHSDCKGTNAISHRYAMTALQSASAPHSVFGLKAETSPRSWRPDTGDLKHVGEVLARLSTLLQGGSASDLLSYEL